MYRFIKLTLLGVLLSVHSAAASGTDFSFQGRLEQHGTPANGEFDFQFRLMDADHGGSPIGSSIERNGVTVSGGLFSVLLDFGLNAFDATPRWVETSVRTSGSGSFDVLHPRQRVTASPFALYAKTIPLAGSGSATTAARSDHRHFGQTWAGGSQHGLRVSNLSVDAESAIAGILIGGTGAEATATSGEIVANAGRGVAGRSLSADGQGIGVYGETQSPEGYAGYFTGGRSYFQNQVGVGVLQPRQQLSIGGHLDLYSGGVNNPTRPSIRGTSTSNLMLSASGSGGTWLNFDGGSGGIRFYDGSGSGGEIGRITSNGRLGIGRTNPQEALHVDGNIRTEGEVVYTYPQGAFATRTRHFVRRWSRSLQAQINYIIFSDENIRLAIRQDQLDFLLRSPTYLRISPQRSQVATSWQVTYGVNQGGTISTPTIGTWYNISNDFDEASGRGGAVYQINNWQVSDASYRISIHKPGLNTVHVIIEAFYTEDPA